MTSRHGRGIDAQQGQSVARRAQEGALALARHGLAEACVDDEGSLGIADQPDEVIHRHRSIVRIAADEVGAARAPAGRILDGIDFVGFPAHRGPRRDWRTPRRLAAAGRERPEGGIDDAVDEVVRHRLAGNHLAVVERPVDRIEEEVGIRARREFARLDRLLRHPPRLRATGPCDLLGIGLAQRRICLLGADQRQDRLALFAVQQADRRLELALEALAVAAGARLIGDGRHAGRDAVQGDGRPVGPPAIERGFRHPGPRRHRFHRDGLEAALGQQLRRRGQDLLLRRGAARPAALREGGRCRFDSCGLGPHGRAAATRSARRRRGPVPARPASAPRYRR